MRKIKCEYCGRPTFIDDLECYRCGAPLPLISREETAYERMCRTGIGIASTCYEDDVYVDLPGPFMARRISDNTLRIVRDKG